MTVPAIYPADAKPPEQSEWYQDVPRSIRGYTVFGIVLLTLTFGTFGAWAFYAPLAAAVIAQGSFVASGQNKIVQHFEGGIIEEILVAEGQSVSEGERLLILDETAALANQRQLELRAILLEAIQVRLTSEFHEEEAMAMPQDLLDRRSEPEIADIVTSQERNFLASRRKLASDIALLESNIASLGARATGYGEQLVSIEVQIGYLRSELEDKRSLLNQGYIRESEINALERAIAEAEGQVGRLAAQIEEARIQQTTFERQIQQTRAAYRQVAIDELQSVEAEYDGVREQIRAAEDILMRSTIHAPVTGIIVRSHYHTPGGVIESGKPIFEITPANVPLLIEAQVGRNDIDSIIVGQSAMIRLTALDQRTTPVLDGIVEYISADALPTRVGDGEMDVYFVRVSVAREELARVPGFNPTPGMPAEVMVQTKTRTFFSYLARPILDSMSRAFREQ
ncbi:MAG: HlyD family type I secretion periplasmic adaptor subunit [Pseudomonadota bacterium]